MKKVQMERRDCCEGIGCGLAGRYRPLLKKARVGKELKSQLAPMVRQADKEGASETCKTQEKEEGEGSRFLKARYVI